MIVFDGEVSKKCNRWISNYVHLRLMFALLFAVTVVSVILLLLCIYWDWTLVIFIITLFSLAFFVIMFVVLFPDKCNESPTIYLAIIKDTLIAKVKTRKGEIMKYGNSIDYINKVVDYGEWYHIIFYFPHNNPFFLCQKDLISEGTIEEFEELFKDKIVRKKLKGKYRNEK